MTPEQFHLFADPLPEPMLLLTGSGLLLAGNRAVEKRLGYSPSDLVGKNLADVVADPPEEVTHYLRSCSRSRSLVLGSLQMAGQGGGISCRAEGALLRPHEAGREAILMFRLTPKESSVGRFVALNQRIEELGKEVQRRKFAEEEARQLSEKLRVTLYGIGDAVITTDLEGRVTMMNPVAEGLTGWTQVEAVGQPLMAVFNIVNEMSREVVESPSGRALRDGVIVGLANHTLLISKDGTERPIADSAAPIRDANGNVVGVVLVFRDYSERRDAERALQEKEKLLAESQRISHVGSWVYSRSGQITWSDETYRIYGLLPGTTAPTSEEFLRLIHPEDRPAMQAWNYRLFFGRTAKRLGVSLSQAGWNDPVSQRSWRTGRRSNHGAELAHGNGTRRYRTKAGRSDPACYGKTVSTLDRRSQRPCHLFARRRGQHSDLEYRSAAHLWLQGGRDTRKTSLCVLLGGRHCQRGAAA